jgi:uncharacterized protein YoxC
MGQPRRGDRRAFRAGLALIFGLHVEIRSAKPHKNSAALTMNLPSDTPRLPKWVFFLGWAALLTTAWLIWDNAAHPTTGLALVSIVICVALAAVIIAIPYVSDYAHRQDEALDNRQRSLQALSVTVAAAAEQVSIAATGLQGIAEAAQENYSKSERLSKQIQEKMADLDGRLAGAKRDDGEIATRYEAAAKKIAKAAGEFEAAVSRASELAHAVPDVPRHIPELPPVIASRIVEIKPAVFASSPPYAIPVAAPEVVPEPAMASEPISTPVASPEAAAEARPPADAAAATPEPVAPAPRKRSPRKPAQAPVAPPADLVLESTAIDEAPPERSAPEIPEPAISADGATRLVVTAYIGIGNRLFIRGDGPGLSWEKGVPLTFVSIGKWRWDTNDAATAVAFKLYKNDEVECTALGERSVEPGAQQELTASF